MARWFETVTDWEQAADTLARRRYGMIEIANGKLVGVHLRPWPKLVAWPDLSFLLGTRRRQGDRCFAYYNQPRSFPQFLALKYMASYSGTSLASIHAALAALDAIARLKRSDAMLCDVANLRVSERMMRRYGWEPHAPARWHRNFIKRFYGVYPV